jgi:Suppressor of fused protein (SUFU)
MDFDLSRITKHIDKTIGPVHTVFHEVVSDDLHIDVHHVKSTLLRRYEVLVTSGMSARPMAVLEGSSEPRFAEMLVVLPKGWRLSKEAFADERNYWPVRLIKSLARFPHHCNTWLGFGHTVANGESEETTRPYVDGTSLCASIVLPPSTLGEAAWAMKCRDGDDVFFWAAVPLHMSELKFKLAHGVDPLLDLFDQSRVTERIDSTRPPAVLN